MTANGVPDRDKRYLSWAEIHIEPDQYQAEDNEQAGLARRCSMAS